MVEPTELRLKPKVIVKPIALDIEWAKRNLRGFEHSLLCVARKNASEAEYREFKRGLK